MAVVVDGVSSGNLIPPAFRERGIEVIHLASSAKVLAKRAADFRREHYVFALHRDAGLSAVCEELRHDRWNVVAVVAASEFGVITTDEIVHELNLNGLKLNGNAKATSRRRRDKEQMIAAARACGVPTIPTIPIRIAPSTSQLIQEAGWRDVTLVVKPAMSAGTDSVTVVETPAQAEEAVTRLLGSENKLGSRNETVLVQQFMEGREYVVDTVSHDGRHRVIDVWYTAKGVYNGRHFVPEYTESLPAEHDRRKWLEEIAFKLLDALGVRFGAGHTEIIWSDKSGPCIVESAARVHGGGFPRFAQELWGSSQVSELVRSYATNTLPPAPERCPERTLRIVELISYQDGTLVALPGARVVRALPTYFSDVLPTPGERVQVTVDAFTSPGVVVLAGRPEDVERDCSHIRRLERDRCLMAVEGG